MRESRKRLLALAVLAAGTAGCAGLGLQVPPDVTLVNLEFTDLTVFETTAEFTVRVSNENPEPITIEGGVFKLYLNGLRIGKGLSSETLEVPRLDSATQDVTLHVSNLALASRIMELIERPTIDYELRSKIYLVRPYGTRRVTINHRGSYSFDSAPGAPARLEAPLPGATEG